jgi:HEAT repeat protein
MVSVASSLALAGLLVFGSAAADEKGAAERVDTLLVDWRDAPATVGNLEGRLVGLGKEAAPRLAALLDQARDDDDPFPVGAVARALARIAQADGVDCLARLSRSQNPSERAAAVVALAEIATPDAMALVLDALKSDVHEEAAAAAAAIADAVDRDPARAPDAEFTRSLHDAPNHDVVAPLLGRLATPAAHETLLRLLSQSDPELQSAAMDGLWDAAVAGDCEPLRFFLSPWRRGALRRKVVLLLGHLHDVEAVPELIDLLKEEDRGLVENTTWALREITGLRLDGEPGLWTDWWERGGAGELAKRAEASEAVDEGAVPAVSVDAHAPSAREPSVTESPPASRSSTSLAPIAAGVLAAGFGFAAIAWVRRRSSPASAPRRRVSIRPAAQRSAPHCAKPVDRSKVARPPSIRRRKRT